MGYVDPNPPCTYYDEQSAAILPCPASYASRQVGCGRLHSWKNCPEDLPYCNNDTGWCCDTEHRVCSNIYCALYYDWMCSDSNPDRLRQRDMIFCGYGDAMPCCMLP